MSSMNAASVVVLPDDVAPPTRTRPVRALASSRDNGGTPSSSSTGRSRRPSSRETPAPDFVKARVPPKKKLLQLRKQNVAVVGGAIAVVAVGALALVRRHRAAITPSA
jgi:hypothetical protein